MVQIGLDGETLATEDSTRSLVSEVDNLSFIFHSIDFCDIKDVVDRRACNATQDLRSLRKMNRVLHNVAERLVNRNRNLTHNLHEVIDLTEHSADGQPLFKRNRFK